MNPLSGLGNRIVSAIQHRQHRKRMSGSAPLSQFYRNGGNDLLYSDLPLTEDDLVIDVGGYHGEWTAGILTRYGCRSELFEPTPAFVEVCQRLYSRNSRVRLHQAALGATSRMTTFSLADTGTSEFRAGADQFEAKVIGVSDFLESLAQSDRISDASGAIGCMKLNIEGGEYEVLEKLLSTGEITRFRNLLIQFHRQPSDYELRYQKIIATVHATHERVWCYPMVWERWGLRNL